MNSIVAFDSAVSNQLIAKDLKSGGVSYKPMGRKAFALTALAMLAKSKGMTVADLTAALSSINLVPVK